MSDKAAGHAARDEQVRLLTIERDTALEIARVWEERCKQARAAAQRAIPVVWSKTTPSVDGFYWWRLDSTKRPIVAMREGGIGMTITGYMRPIDQLGGEWGPPIPEPEKGGDDAK